MSAHPQPADVMLPAPGQGILALETRAGVASLRGLRPRSTIRPPRGPRAPSAAWSPPSAATARCRSPPGRATATAFCALSVFIASRDGSRFLETTVAGADPDAAAAAAVERLIAAGAEALLDRDSA